MGKRTLMSCWKQYEKLSGDYLDEEKDKDATIAKLSDLTRKANADQIGHALLRLFVSPHIPACNTLDFSVLHNGGGLPDWETSFDTESGTMLVNPVTVIQFIKKIKVLTPEAIDRNDFVICRHTSFLLEIARLPVIYIVFLLVLQRVAYIMEITHLEKRGGIIEIAEDESYHTLLWAFKELEIFVKNTYGVNVRAHYGISWYEAEWITGR